MRRRIGRTVAALAAVLGAVVLLLALGLPGGDRPPRSDADDGMALVATVRPDSGAGSAPIARSFLGLSMEYWGFAHDAGVHAGSPPDPLLARLVRGLASGGGPPMLRVGGRSSDASWWDPARRRAPAGVTYDITPRWLARLRQLTEATHARVLLGVNLAIRRPGVAVAWARAAARALPHGALAGFEVGNEPDLYGHVAWYRVPPARAAQVLGRYAHGKRYARGGEYDMARFTREFLAYAAAVRRIVPGARFTGPGLSTPRWMPRLPAFLRATGPVLAAATFHRYPLRTCHAPPQAATAAHLLAPAASGGLAASVAPYVAQARARDLPFWITELNSVACGGRRGVSDTFSSALWGLDTLLGLAHAGVARVEIHTRPDTAYSPFKLRLRHGRWVARVAPLYAALRLFARLTPPGTRVAPLRVDGRFRIVAWRLTDPSGTQRVVVIDEDPAASGAVRVMAGTRAPARLVRLDAPSLGSTAAPRIAGQAYGADARLHGRRRTELVRPDGDGYAVVLRRPGVAVLTIG